MPRMLGLLAALVLLFGACTAQADPAAPGAGPPTTASADTAPYRLDRLDALGAMRLLRPGGFRRVLTCPRRQHEGCQREGTGSASWLVGTQSHGADLRRGKGSAEFVRAIATSWPSPAAARAYADRLARQLKRYRGEYDIALEETGPRTYAPGDRGRGDLQRVSMRHWRGTGLRRVFHYVFDDLSPSANVLGGHFVLRRGRYVAEIEWQARNQATDRRLSRLPARLIRGLR